MQLCACVKVFKNNQFTHTLIQNYICYLQLWIVFGRNGPPGVTAPRHVATVLQQDPGVYSKNLRMQDPAAQDHQVQLSHATKTPVVSHNQKFIIIEINDCEKVFKNNPFTHTIDPKLYVIYSCRLYLDTMDHLG